MKTLLKGPKNTFLKFLMRPVTSGRFWPSITSEKSRKSSKNRKNRDFSKIDILLYSGRKYDIWPEIGPLDPGKYPKILYWSPYLIWLQLRKSEKIRIFDPKNQGKKFFKVDFLGRWVLATKAILGIDRPYWCPQTPIISLYTTYPFLPISSIKISSKLPKNHFFYHFA